jgi:branched-chain amino acid transport system permease protein
VDATIVISLVQDGLVNGAIYALVAVALVVVFAVTRVILIPQGVFVAFAALTLGQFEQGERPGTASLLLVTGILACALDLLRGRRHLTPRFVIRRLAIDIVPPAVLYALVTWLAPRTPGVAVEVLLTLLLVAPLGPYVYRIAFRPLADASVLVLLIAAVGVHLALTVLGLGFFGPEGFRADPLIDASFELGGTTIQAQQVVVVAASFAVMLALWLFFEQTLFGKALRAVAVNRTGARLVGIPIGMAGEVAFAIATVIGAVSGILIAPVTMLYYDSGFLIGLKGFVAAIIGGLGSYPLTVAGAFGVGLVQSFAAFWTSTFMEVVVFTLIIPVLLIRSLRAPVVEEEDG